MRKEASIDLWRDLYELACNIRVLEPWNYLWDMDLIGIELEEKFGSAYCSVLGRGGECYGIGIHAGDTGLRDFLRVANNSWGEVPPEQFMLDQDCLTCYWGDREEVPAQQKKIIKELGYKFRGKGNWLYFISYKKRYFPYTPDEQEVKLLIEVFKNLFIVIKALHDGCLTSSQSAGQIIWRQFNKQTGGWINRWIDLPKVDIAFPQLKLADLFMRKQLQKKPKIALDLIVDVAYLHTAVKDNRYERPVSTMVLLVINAADGNIVKLDILKPEQDDQLAVLDFFTEFVRNNGRMRMVITRNPKVKASLQDTCKYCKIPLIEREVEELAFVLDMLEESF